MFSLLIADGKHTKPRCLDVPTHSCYSNTQFSHKRGIIRKCAAQIYVYFTSYYDFTTSHYTELPYNKKFYVGYILYLLCILLVAQLRAKKMLYTYASQRQHVWRIG